MARGEGLTPSRHLPQGLGEVEFVAEGRGLVVAAGRPPLRARLGGFGGRCIAPRLSVCRDEGVVRQVLRARGRQRLLGLGHDVLFLTILLRDDLSSRGVFGGGTGGAARGDGGIGLLVRLGGLGLTGLLLPLGGLRRPPRLCLLRFFRRRGSGARVAPVSASLGRRNLEVRVLLFLIVLLIILVLVPRGLAPGRLR